MILHNFARGTVSTTYDASATSIALTAGHGARFPSTFPYRCVWWNWTDYPNPSDDPNREIVEVTGRATDTLTVVRGRETTAGGLAASTKNTAVVYRMALVPTAESVEPVQTAASQVEAEAGTEAALRSFSPLRIGQAIAALRGFVTQNSKSAAYETVLADAGKHILHPSADTTARIFTIPANASVAYAIGTQIAFVNQDSAGVVTIAITTDTMRLAGAGTTGSRTLAANGIATALKITSTEWIISGTGLT